jgi:LAGLIDADG DNA endonuclease family
MSNLNLPLLTKEVLIGLILGDASLVRKYPNGNAYLKYAQSIKHAEYLNLVFSHLKPFCNMTSPTLGQSKIKSRSHHNSQFPFPFLNPHPHPLTLARVELAFRQ